jgi:hypothetical protein
MDLLMWLIIAAILLGIWTHASGFAQATGAVSSGGTNILKSLS